MRGIMTYLTITSAASFIAGTLFGSFFYTAALRYAGGEFTKSPWRAMVSRSRCPSCGKAVSVIGLIPVVGFIVQAGKCRACGTAISPLYPASEIAFGVLALFTAHTFGINPLSISHYLVMATGTAIALIDVKTMRIPIPMVAALLIISASPVAGSGGFAGALQGMLLMAVFFGAVLLIFPGAFGGGDLWYASALGFIFDLELAAVLLEVSLISGALFGIAYALWTKKGFRTRIPFAPFLTLGLIVTVFFGRKIVLLYYGIVF